MTEPDPIAPPASSRDDAAAAAARFVAVAAGEADVVYATVDSPVGRLLAAQTPKGLVRLSWEAEDDVLAELSDRLSPRILEAPARMDAVRRELEEYFAGTRERFDVVLDWTLTSDFTRRILVACAAIPFGQTASYGQMAAAAGNPRASRAAGRALNVNPIPIVVPCHRVLGKSGALVGYAGGIERKVALLRLEGLTL